MINHKSNKTKSEPALIYVYSEEKMVLLLRVTVAPLVLVFTNLFPTCEENRNTAKIIHSLPLKYQFIILSSNGFTAFGNLTQSCFIRNIIDRFIDVTIFF